MLTEAGRGLLATVLAQRLAGGALEVSDGNGAAARAPLSATAEAGVCTCTAIFDERSANFEWRAYRVLDGAGLALDETSEDMGRKAAGAVWTLEAGIELGVEQ